MMFEAIISTLLGLMGTMLMAVIAWANSISNRVSVIESEKDNLKEFIKELMDIRFQEVTRRLDSIDRRLYKSEV